MHRLFSVSLFSLILKKPTPTEPHSPFMNFRSLERPVYIVTSFSSPSPSASSSPDPERSVDGSVSAGATPSPASAAELSVSSFEEPADSRDLVSFGGVPKPKPTGLLNGLREDPKEIGFLQEEGGANGEVAPKGLAPNPDDLSDSPHLIAAALPSEVPLPFVACK